MIQNLNSDRKEEVLSEQIDPALLTREQQIELEAKMKELKLTSRQLPDSAMYTYFGKPAFFAYGNANTNPTNAHQKLKTHNINPHSGGNKPEFSQVHGRALLGGTI